jgi:hypothetical protein
VPSVVGGGVPSSNLFYKNPQYIMWLDQSKLKNKAHAALPLELMITYMAKDDKGAVKAFLCKASKNGERVSVINDETTVDPT